MSNPASAGVCTCDLLTESVPHTPTTVVVPTRRKALSCDSGQRDAGPASPPPPVTCTCMSTNPGKTKHLHRASHIMIGNLCREGTHCTMPLPTGPMAGCSVGTRLEVLQQAPTGSRIACRLGVSKVRLAVQHVWSLPRTAPTGIDNFDLQGEVAHCRRLCIVEQADDLGACGQHLCHDSHVHYGGERADNNADLAPIQGILSARAALPAPRSRKPSHIVRGSTTICALCGDENARCIWRRTAFGLPSSGQAGRREFTSSHLQ